MQADLILHHGRIYTVDAAFSQTEALAIRDGLIQAVGSNQDILGRFEAPQKIHLGGKSVYPGFIDAHGHLSRYGRSRFEADLRDAESWEACVDRLRAFAQTQPEGWLIGRGWDQTRWVGRKFPDKRLLDEAFPDRPVLLERVDIHAMVVNQYLLDQTGLTPESHIPGGEIGVEEGELTGLLIDAAQQPVWDLMPPSRPEDLRRYLRQAAHDCARVGLTGVGDALLDHDSIVAIRQLQQAGEFPLRVYGMLPADEAHRDRYLHQGPQRDEWLHLGGFKFFADGTLGSRSAWLSEPYADAPAQVGLALLAGFPMRDWLMALHHHGWQAVTHAIGDAACRWVLDRYAEVMPSGNPLRWRIEHLQVLTPEDCQRVAALGVIPSLQPTHCTSDMRWVGARLGTEREKWGYRQASLLEQGGLVALGSDFPVESINPLLGFYAAITRQDLQGWPENGYLPNERLTRVQALRGMTIWAAYAQGEEAWRGSLEPGKVADLLVMPLDLMKAPPEEIAQAQIEAVGLAGKMVFGEETF